MKRYYCTYFDRNYLVKALALIESLTQFSDQDFEIFAVCLDEISRIILQKLNLKHVTTIPLHKIEQYDEPLLGAKKNRSLVEYYFTLTPTIILRLLECLEEKDCLTYIDADCYFFSSPEPIFCELCDSSILIQPHRFSPAHRHREQWGIYNVGIISFRNDSSGIEALNWWRERCIEWCYARLEDGKYADQLYLNDWPERFENVKVLQHVGAGVAPWNQEQYCYRLDDPEIVLVNELPLIFYHFHSLIFRDQETIIADKLAIYLITGEILRLCYLPYMHALSRAIDAVKSILPDFTFGLNDDIPLAAVHTFAVRSQLVSRLEPQNISHKWIELDDEWSACLGTPTASYFSENIISVTTPGHEESLNEKGENLFKAGDIDAAIDLFKKASEKDRDSHAAHNNLGVAYWQIGNQHKAQWHLEKAVGQNASYRPAVINYAQIMKCMHQNNEALKICRTYLQKYPDDLEIIRIIEELSSVS